MHIPNNSTRGADSPSEPRHELLNNPITYEIILMIAVVSFAMLMVFTMRCLQSCIAPDDDHCWADQLGDAEEQARRPLDLTLTADGDLLDNNEAGGKSLKYGTFYVDHGKWYTADGTEISYDDWIERVYDPLD